MFTQSSKLLPTRGSATALRSGIKAFFDRRIAYLFLAAASASVLAIPAAAADGVDGYWLTNNGASIVEVAPCGSSRKRMCGTVVWASDASASEVGTELLKSFRPVGKKSGGRWNKGKIRLESGKSRAAKLRFNDGKLKVSTCKGQSCTHVTWTRPSSIMTAQAGLKDGAE